MRAGRLSAVLAGPILFGLVLAACAPEPEPPAGGDFAVLAQGADGFEQARPGTALQFPRDHGAHPGYRIEWWYLTANLQDASGQEYGAQWTLFRTAAEPPGIGPPANPWQDPQVFMAHVAITAPGGHIAFQRYARGGDHGGVARAGVTAQPFSAWLDDWSLQSVAAGWLPLVARARQGRYALELTLSSELPPVLQGADGFSQKNADGGGSWYYSQPFLNVAGELVVDGQTVPVTGQGWLDHEWSSQFLQPGQAGWDWFAMHLESGEKLMLFRLRPRDPADLVQAYVHGAIIGPDGSHAVLDPARIAFEVLETTRVAGRDLPLHWRIRLPEVGRDLVVEPLLAEQWMDVDFAYWEGAIRVSGEGPAKRGRGYMELTGYPLSR